MKYRDLPRLRFKRGTSRKMRSQTARISRKIFDDLYAQGLQRTFMRSSIDAMIYGQSKVIVGWDLEGGLTVINAPPWAEP